MQLELADADRPRPLLGLPEQGRSDSAPAMQGGDHEAEVGDVPARRVGVAAERQPADDAVGRELGDEHGGVVVAAQRAQEPPLFAGRPPGSVRDQPALGLRGDGLGELDERTGIPGFARRTTIRSAVDDDSMASPAGVACRCQRPVRPHLDRGGAAEVQVPAPPADDVVAAAVELVQRGGIVTSLAVDVAVVQVNSWCDDRLVDRQSVAERVHDDLKDGAPEPGRARAADDDSRPSVLEDD